MQKQDFKVYIDRDSQNRYKAQPARASLALTLSLVLPLFVFSVLSGVFAMQMPDDPADVLEHPWAQQGCRYFDCSRLVPVQSYSDVSIQDMRLIQYGTTLVFNGYLSNPTNVVDWPQLNLTLRNTKGRDVAQYQLQPSDYLLDDAAPQMTATAQAIRFSVANMDMAVAYFITFEALSL